MNPRRKRRLDIAGPVGKWLAIGVTASTLLKGCVDMAHLQAQNEALATSVVTVVNDQANEADRRKGLRTRVARLEERVRTLERRGGASSKRPAASRTVDGIEVVAKSPGPMDIITAPFKWLGRLLGG